MARLILTSPMAAVATPELAIVRWREIAFTTLSFDWLLDEK